MAYGRDVKLLLSPLKNHPRPLIIGLPITHRERRLVDDRALDGPARLGVVLDHLLDGAGGHVLDLLPRRALETDAREAAVLGVDDAAVLIVSRFLVILSQGSNYTRGLRRYVGLARRNSGAESV